MYVLPFKFHRNLPKPHSKAASTYLEDGEERKPPLVNSVKSIIR